MRKSLTFYLCFLSFFSLSALHAEQYQNRKLGFSSPHFCISLLGLWLESQFQGWWYGLWFGLPFPVAAIFMRENERDRVGIQPTTVQRAGVSVLRVQRTGATEFMSLGISGVPVISALLYREDSRGYRLLFLAFFIAIHTPSSRCLATDTRCTMQIQAFSCLWSVK